MTTPRATAEFYRAQQRLAVAAIATARRLWTRMGTDFDTSWSQIGSTMTLLASSAQTAAVRQAEAYMVAVLAETAQVDVPEAQVNGRALVGVAADGRTLDGLLYGAVTHTKARVGDGVSAPDALKLGGSWLDSAMHAVVADAGRGMVGLGIAVRPHMGYVRMLNPPSCARCAILAGKFYRWNQGFARHLNCDCVHIPAPEDRAGDFRTDSKAMFGNGQVTGLSQADARAISDGADPARVVNAHRGISTANTVFGRRLTVTSRASRVTPESIYASTTDRAEALRLLRRFGYIL